MKRLKIISALTIAALFSSVVIINSCSKQEMNENTTDEDVKISESDMVFANKLIGFKKKIEFVRDNPAYKSDEVINADDAIWSMEALFNATYGFAGENYKATKTDTDIIMIDVDDNGDVLLDDLVVKYDEITDLVSQFYYNSGFEEKGLILLDLTKGEVTGTQMEVTVRSVTGEKDLTPFDPFGNYDFWYYGLEAGDCDETPGTGGTDAAEKIQEAIMSNRLNVQPEPNEPPGYHLVYEVDEVITKYGWEYTDENENYLIFFISNNNGVFNYDETCLIPEEMNFHFHGEETVIYEIIPSEYIKPGWVLIECNLVGEDYSQPPDLFQIRHRNEITYGYRHLVPDGVFDPPHELPH